MIDWGLACRKSLECSAVHDENIRPAVVVVVEDGNSGTGGLDDVLFGIDSAKDNFRG